MCKFIWAQVQGRARKSGMTLEAFPASRSRFSEVLLKYKLENRVFIYYIQDIYNIFDEYFNFDSLFHHENTKPNTRILPDFDV